MAGHGRHALAALGAAVFISVFSSAAELTAGVPARPHGKLDLDIFGLGPATALPRENLGGAPLRGWVPGDPRAERGEPEWVRHLSHVGYAGLGAAGLAASVASGGVAPAIGFGIVTLYHSLLEWRQLKNTTMVR